MRPRLPPHCRRASSFCEPSGASNLPDHRDRPTRALLVTDRAPGAFVEVVLVTPAGSQLDDRLLGAGREATIALEAVAARETALRLVLRRGGNEPFDHFVECAAPAIEADAGLCPPSRGDVIPGPQHRERR